MTARRLQQTAVTVIGVLAVLVGLVWVGQGLNLIPGSLMTGDPKWFVIGAIVLLVGVLLILVGRGRRSRPGTED